MQYRILLVALEAELPYKQAPKDYKVIYTGVGKVNAAVATAQAIMEANSLGFHPVVLNYGTAGSCKQDLAGLQPMPILPSQGPHAKRPDCFERALGFVGTLRSRISSLLRRSAGGPLLGSVVRATIS